MEDGETNNTSNELEVVQMFRVDTGVRIDLECVVVVRGVFEEAVKGVEHLVGEEEEEFTVRMSVLPHVNRNGMEGKTYRERPP
jgi:hypothetical protein